MSNYSKAAMEFHKEEQQKMMKDVDEAFAELDTDGSGTLSKAEVVLVLKHITGDGQDPSDEAISEVMRAAGSKEEDGEIKKDKLIFALRRYNSYQRNQQLVVALFKNIAENPDDMREEIGMGQTPYAGIKITLTDEEMDHAPHDILEI